MKKRKKPGKHDGASKVSEQDGMSKVVSTSQVGSEASSSPEKETAPLAESPKPYLLQTFGDRSQVLIAMVHE
eukprot:4634866-Prymnesium_polylepis.3